MQRFRRCCVVAGVAKGWEILEFGHALASVATISIMNWFEQRIAQTLQQRQDDGLLRVARKCNACGPGLIKIDGRTLINFGANDYLGLAWRHSSMATDPSHPFGSAASPLLTGRCEIHDTLETKLAAWKATEAALTFTSGYAANVSVIAALGQAGDQIFSDQLNHASIIDGCRLSKANIEIYPHAYVQKLRDLLVKHRSKRESSQGVWIASDTIFSMEGDAAPLEALGQLATEFDAGLILDDAHAVGIYGSGGNGLSAMVRLDSDKANSADFPLITIGTASKALGCVGGYVVGTQATIDYLRQFSRGYIYSTAAPPSVAFSIIGAIASCEQMEYQRQVLRQISANFRERLRQQGWETTGEDSPICPVYMGSPQIALELSARLLDAGFFVPAIRPPTVPVGRSLLRVSLSVSHNAAQVEGLLSALRSSSF